MTLKGDVLNSSIEERDLVGKDGAKRRAKVSHVLLICNDPKTKQVEVVNLRAYDAEWALPNVGDKAWETPRIRKYENYDGNVAEVSC